LQISLASVFIWFGVDKFIHPQYWLSTWVPVSVIDFSQKIGIEGLDVVYAGAIFELLVGVSLLSNVFVKIFSFFALFFLISNFFVIGINESLVKDLGLIGGFLALFFWPDQRRF
jgi:uncharacterized membrane protein YphA (DoxX/SURF4 family)